MDVENCPGSQRSVDNFAVRVAVGGPRSAFKQCAIPSERERAVDRALRWEGALVHESV